MNNFKWIFWTAIGIACFPLTISPSFAENIPENAYSHIDNTCKEDWTNDEKLNVSMYNLCVDMSHDALIKLKTIRKQYRNHAWYGLTEKFCFNSWTNLNVINIKMTVNCLEGQISGYSDLAYYRNNGLNALVESCIAETTSQLGYMNWAFANYCVKKKHR